MKKLLLTLNCILLTFQVIGQDIFFTVDTDNGCAPLSVNYTNETHLTIDTLKMVFIWDYDDGSEQDTGYHASHTYVNPGRYVTYLYAFDSLGELVPGYTREISVQGFSGAFTPADSSQYCPNEYIYFRVEEEYNTILWDYGDGSEKEEWNHTNHQYNTPGFYTVRLDIDHSCGVDSAFQVVEITNSAIPQPNIWPNQETVCITDQVRFSHGVNGSSVLWDFGDGNNSTQFEPSHSYADTGHYWVTVEVTNVCGNTGIDSFLMVVDTGINVNANMNWWGQSNCPNDIIYFNTGSSGSYQWDFGNGETGTMMNEMVSYSDTGIYEVQLVVTNGCGVSDTAVNYIDIMYDTLNVPFVQISLWDNDYNQIDTLIVCPGSEVQFGNYSGGQGESIEYTWYFGDIDTLVSSDPDIYYTFNEVGNHVVQLVGLNNCGGSDTSMKWIFVTDTLTPNSDLQVLPQLLCPGEFVYFFDEGGRDDYRYSIWFGDTYSLIDVGPENDTLVPVTARHQYFNLGFYEFTFSVTNACGNTLTREDTIFVNDTLGESFLLAMSETDSSPERRACPNDIIEFYGIGGTSVYWDFGGGVYDTNIVGLHSYPDTGIYTAHAIFTTGCGVIDTVEVLAYVGDQSLPDNGFDYHYNGSSLCAGDTIEFEYQGWDDGYNNLSFLWYFGDGDSSTARDPIHIYDTIGDYNIELMVTNGCGTSINERFIQVGGIFIDDASVVLTDPDCGLTNGEISGISSSGGSVSSISWLNANDVEVGTDYDISGLGAGQYSILVESLSGCAAMSGPYQLNNTGAPSAPLATDLYEYCMLEPMSDLTAEAQSGGTLIWYSDPALSDSLDTGTNFNPGATTTSSFYVTETIGICESPAVEVTVVFHHLYEFIDTLQLCDGDEYFAGGDFQSTDGTYYDSLTTIFGCDSVIITTLEYRPISRNEEIVHLCPGQEYYVGGEWQNENGVYFDTLQAANGCDSIMETTLLYTPDYFTPTDASICAGDSIFLDGEWRTTGGIYTENLYSIYGCDSIVEVNLTVGDININTDYQIICEGDSIFFNGEWRKAAGTYNDTLVSGTSCDSINQLVLTVGDLYIVSRDISICEGDSIKLGGVWQTEAGVYNDTLLSYYGCDSVIQTTVSINTPTETPVSLTICDGESVFLEGMWQTEPGIYYDVLIDINGCDSTIITTLIVNSTYEVLQTEIICSNESIFLQGEWQTDPGVYYDSLETVLGCDSVIVTTLIVNDTYEVLAFESFCSGDSVFVEDEWVKTEGIYHDTLLSVDDCDSVVVTTVERNDVYMIQLTENICTGDSVFLEGAWQKTSGTYTDNFTSIFGCDSTVEVTLGVGDINIASDYITICDGDSVLFAGEWYKTTGVYNDTLVSGTSCDSIDQLVLTVGETFETPASASICDNDSILLEGEWQTAAGTYYDTLLSKLGCDSVIITTLTIKPTFVTPVSESICEGEEIYLEGEWQTEAGVYYDILVGANGCDSIIETTLTVLTHIHYGSRALSICTGDSVMLGSEWRTSAGTYADTIVGPLCDSIYDIVLSLEDPVTYPVTDEICSGDSIHLEGAWQTTPGTYYDTYPNINGCDSIIETTLTVLTHIHYGSRALSICTGDSVMLGSEWRTAAGTYADTIVGPLCDSIFNIVLSLEDPVTYPVTDGICAGDSIFVGGAWQTAPGTYYDTLPNINGCDSIIETTLTSISYIDYGSRDHTICNGDSILLGSVWRTTAGTYVDTITGPLCDSIFSVVLSIEDPVSTPVSAEICEGEEILLGGMMQTTAGTYYDTLATVNGCDSIIVTTLTVNTHIDYGARNATICEGDSVLLGSVWRKTAGTYADTIVGPLCDSVYSVTLAVTPTGSSTISETICVGDSIQIGSEWVSEAGTYSYTLIGNGGCDSVITVNVTADTCGTFTIDNEITSWSIYPNPSEGMITIQVDQADNEELRIFDNTGKLVYKTRVLIEKVTVDFTDMPEGLYIIHYRNAVQEVLLKK